MYEYVCFFLFQSRSSSKRLSLVSAGLRNISNSVSDQIAVSEDRERSIVKTPGTAADKATTPKGPPKAIKSVVRGKPTATVVATKRTSPREPRARKSVAGGKATAVVRKAVVGSTPSAVAAKQKKAAAINRAR